jgi:putative pyruvate formate lyase activating enzyme
MSKETMCVLRSLIDVWLPDFKFGPGKCALDLSRTPWYWDTVTNNLRLLYEWEEDFVIRHLIMPNHVECCTKPVLDWIARNMPEISWINIIQIICVMRARKNIESVTANLHDLLLKKKL